jgi:hypothetical protein
MYVSLTCCLTLSSFNISYSVVSGTGCQYLHFYTRCISSLCLQTHFIFIWFCRKFTRRLIILFLIEEIYINCSNEEHSLLGMRFSAIFNVWYLICIPLLPCFPFRYFIAFCSIRFQSNLLNLNKDTILTSSIVLSIS